MGLHKDLGIVIGKGTPGPRNLITDVPGVTVGHVTVQDGEINTGVTAILPHQGNIFQDKVMAASAVINGFGKSMGLVQVEELGTIETPIVMTNTLSIGTAATALIKYMLNQNPDIGDTTGTVNPLVCECNDGSLSDIRGLHITEEHVLKALESTGEDFEEGAVGSGTGMSCLGFKGGIGSASRQLELDGKTYTIGALVMSNMGRPGHLMIDGRQVGREIKAKLDEEKTKGSIIMVIATDVPLNERQLKRVCRRAGVGLARTGAFYENGSGDVAVAFTTANRIPNKPETAVMQTKMLHDNKIDPVLEMTAEAVEEAIISSLYHAEAIVGRAGKTWHCLREFL
jgi:D-aminopeptidase